MSGNYKIGAVVGIKSYQWQVVGYLCTGDGIQAVGSSTEEGDRGRERREWISGFNRAEGEVWKQIESLPISEEAKRQLGEKGFYPSHLLTVVGTAHDNWRRSIGKDPDWWAAMLVRKPRPLSAPCPF